MKFHSFNYTVLKKNHLSFESMKRIDLRVVFNYLGTDTIFQWDYFVSSPQQGEGTNNSLESTSRFNVCFRRYTNQNSTVQWFQSGVGNYIKRHQYTHSLNSLIAKSMQITVLNNAECCVVTCTTDMRTVLRACHFTEVI